MKAPNSFLEMALSYAARGWAVLPLRPKGKAPLTTHGFKDASTNPEQIKEWWRRWPDANIGIATGKISGLFVIDVDGKYPDDFPVLPALAQVKTHKGFHYYFKYPSGCVIKSKTKIQKSDVDIRGDGGYIVAPPSIHPSGQAYQLLTETLELYEASKEIISFLETPQAPQPKPDPSQVLDEDEIVEMLSYINPDIDYSTWLQIGMALHSGGYCLGIWEDWSRKGKKYKQGECAQKWYSFVASGGITMATFVKIARDAGYTNQSSSISYTPKTSDFTRTKPKLERCSDVSLAHKLMTDLEERYGDIVYCENCYWYFNQTHWAELCPDSIIRPLLHDYDGLPYGNKNKYINLSNQKIEGIMTELSYLRNQPNFFQDVSSGINCLSGFICFDNESNPFILKHSTNDKQRFTIPAHWPPEKPQSPLLNTLLEGCFRGDTDYAEKITLIGEIIGAACLGYATKIKSPKAIIFVGESANNGKSQILKMIRGLLPNDALSAISPANFAKDNYKAELMGKALNACDELNSKAISSDIFKLMITGDEVTGRALYQRPISFAPKALHLFATNILPPFQSGIDLGIKRRLLVLRFNRSIPKSEVIENISARILSEEINQLLSFVVRGAQRLVKNGGYTEPESSQEALNDWLLNADPVRAWVDCRTEPLRDFRIEHKRAYADFKNFCEEEGFRNIPAANLFSQRLRPLIPHYDKVRLRDTRFHVGFKIKE